MIARIAYNALPAVGVLYVLFGHAIADLAVLGVEVALAMLQ